jgi:hypothetical protein
MSLAVAVDVEVDERVSLDLIDAGFGKGWNPEVMVGGRSDAGESTIVSVCEREMRFGAEADGSEVEVGWSLCTVLGRAGSVPLDNGRAVSSVLLEIEVALAKPA